MEDFQNTGDALAKAIMDGNAEEAHRIIQEAIYLDAEFEIYVEPKGKSREIAREVEEVKQGKNNEIYEKLVEMGVDRDQALKLASKYNSLDEALNSAFN